MSALLLLSALLLAEPADVRISNSHLQIACLDGKAVPARQRKWKLPARAVSMTFTMRNEPRVGRPGADAGFASIAFTPENGHNYEIEVRSDPMLYASRVWPKGEWRAVVRDRATEKIVSSEPRWVDGPECGDRRDLRLRQGDGGQESSVSTRVLSRPIDQSVRAVSDTARTVSVG